MSRYPRTSPRLSETFSDQPMYFVTCCVHNRRRILATETVHNAFVEFAEDASHHGIAVGRYVLMPDHLHLFVAGHRDFDLGRWVGTLKRILAKHLAPSNAATEIWQRGFFDHVLRNDESYSQKWDYVRENPVRAGLVRKVEDWPFAGEIVDLEFE